MIITYLRSSSYTCYDFCQFKYFLTYNLSLQENANKKAIIGNIVHKALEIMAMQKLTMQNNQTEVYESESQTKISIKDNTEKVLKIAYKYYADLEHYLNWEDEDYLRCKQLLNKALTFDNGKFNPLNLEIFMPEQKFDIEIKEPWAWFDYGNDNKGYLRLRGTIDLIVKEDNYYHILDWKTGRLRYDWGKEKEKTDLDLNKDPQLVMYFLAAKTLFPDKQFCLTIYYIDHNEPIAVMFDDSTLEYAKKIIKKRFTDIKNSQNPKKNKTWKCTKLCHFGKTDLDNLPIKNYTGSVCDILSKEMQQIGLTKLWEKRAIDKKFETYSGGGKSNVNIRGESTDETRPIT